MITVITGNPGAGKTALAVDMLMREYSDRQIFSDGVNGLLVEHEPIDVLNWQNDAPDGALIIVDEVQRKWRNAGPGAKVHDSIVALETHRHRGIDLILVTQKPKLIHLNVRELAGRHLHIRDTWSGRWLYEWPECEPTIPWKRCENKRKYHLPKHVFDKYKSATMHIKPIRKRPLMLYLLGLGVLLLAYLLWSIFSGFGEITSPASTSSTPATVTPSAGPALTPSSAPPPPASATLVAGPSIDDRTAWIPRVSHMPESAPAFDGIRTVKQMPVVSGGVCIRGECRCFTQQGTDSGLSHHDCLEQMTRPRFDAYSEPPPKPAPEQKQETSTEPPPLEIRHAIATQNELAKQEVTKAARTSQLVSTGSLN